MKFKSLICFGFAGIVAIGAVTASAVYLPQIKIGDNFYGTQLVDNVTTYSKIKNAQPSGVNVFTNNGNLGKFIGGTPNVSLEKLLNGTDSYSNGNYIVLFASDGDPLSNLFLYGEAFRFNANEKSDVVDYHKFGFSIDQKTNKPKFDSNFVSADFSKGYIQSSFQYITNQNALKIMSALPSIVLVHDKINYDVMESLINYQNYVKSCFHDVVTNTNGKYSFAVGSKNYQKYAENNPKDAPNYQANNIEELFQGLVGYNKEIEEGDKDYEKNQELLKEAEKLVKEYNWAENLKKEDPVCFGYQFNPVNSSLETNTYPDPEGISKPYRTDIGAKKYVEAITQFKNKFSPSYVTTNFGNQINGGHYIGFAHSQSKLESVVLNDDLSSTPKDTNGNEMSNLNQFAGKSANSKFSASLVSLYNGVSNSSYNGISLYDKYISNTTQPKLNQNIFINPNDKRTFTLKTWFYLK